MGWLPLVLLVVLSVLVAGARWLLPPKSLEGSFQPTLSHDGLRWRVFTRAAGALPRLPFVLVLVPGMASLATLLLLAGLGVGILVSGTLVLVGLSRVDLEADASGVRLTRRFRKPVSLRWSAVERITWNDRELGIVSSQGRLAIPIPHARHAAEGARVARWLEHARRRSTQIGPGEPIPDELRRFVAASAVRSAQPEEPR